MKIQTVSVLLFMFMVSLLIGASFKQNDMCYMGEPLGECKFSELTMTDQSTECPCVVKVNISYTGSLNWRVEQQTNLNPPVVDTGTGTHFKTYTKKLLCEDTFTITFQVQDPFTGEWSNPDDAFMTFLCIVECEIK